MLQKIHNVLIINGPNLNLLGSRENKQYGNQSLPKIVRRIKIFSKLLKMNVQCFQSNSESSIINKIHKSVSKYDFIIINPAALSHTSIALRDAFLSVKIPFIEIHLSNIYSREKFRHFSYLSDIAKGVICGLGSLGYFLALYAINKDHFFNKKF